ncbi:MAG TPA: malate/lactate/ureidoglycolate dehydrogenase [Geminicoccaceae bacterium]
MTTPAEPLEALVRQCFEAAGCAPGEAAVVAHHLVEANLMGHDSHGVIRVLPYVEMLRAGKWTAGGWGRVVKDAGAVVTIDGGQRLGQVVAHQAVEIGCERAKAHGIALVGVQNSAHMGRIGAWAEQAATHGMLSILCVNTTGYGIQVAPFGGSDRRLSVNPIALGVPRPGQEPLIHDMSTGAIAAGKVRVARNAGTQLPEGCLIDNQGRPSRDPEAFFTDPPGALTTTGAHKGSGLALFVEVLAGALTGGGAGHPDHPTADRPVNNLFAVFIDPDAMAGMDAIAADLDRLVDYVRASPPIVPGGEVLLPGEPERRSKAKRLAEGIPLDPNTLGQVRHAARTLGLAEEVIDRGIGPADPGASSDAAAMWAPGARR